MMDFGIQKVLGVKSKKNKLESNRSTRWDLVGTKTEK